MPHQLGTKFKPIRLGDILCSNRNGPLGTSSVQIISSFSHSCDKIPKEKRSGKKGSLGLTIGVSSVSFVESHHRGGEVREPEEAGHMATTLRKQKVTSVCIQLACSLSVTLDPAHRTVPLILRVALPPRVTQHRPPLNRQTCLELCLLNRSGVSSSQS